MGGTDFLKGNYFAQTEFSDSNYAKIFRANITYSQIIKSMSIPDEVTKGLHRVRLLRLKNLITPVKSLRTSLIGTILSKFGIDSKLTQPIPKVQSLKVKLPRITLHIMK